MTRDVSQPAVMQRENELSRMVADGKRRHLDGDFLVLLTLRRVRRSGLAMLGDQFCDRGQPMPPGLLRDTLDVLLELG